MSLMNINMRIETPARQCVLFTWPRPPQEFWVLACDGSLKPDRVGYGGLIHNCDGEPLIGYVGTAEQHHVLWLKMFALYRRLMVVKNFDIIKLRV